MIWSECNEKIVTSPAKVNWDIPPATIDCKSRQIHLWRVSINLPDNRLDAFTATLSADEHARADTFIRNLRRRRFITGRGALRDILSRYLHITPTQVQIEITEDGKPILTMPETGGLHFNIAHAHDYLLIGIARQPIGVDFEFLQNDLDLPGIALRNFSPEQTELLLSKNPDEQQYLFYIYWTRLEAHLKAIGTGFIEKTENKPDHPQPTPLCCNIEPMPQYMAAIAIENKCDEIMFWDFV